MGIPTTPRISTCEGARRDDVERIVAALEDFGFGGLGLTPADFQEPDVVVQLGSEPQRIDMITCATGLAFEDAYDHRVTVEIGGLPAPFLSVEDLRTNKLATGRLRDQADAAELPPGADAQS